MIAMTSPRSHEKKKTRTYPFTFEHRRRPGSRVIHGKDLEKDLRD